MRFLVDAQLPPALARFLASAGHDAAHVADLGLLDAPDRAIWRQAANSGAVLVTKDGDFLVMRTLEPTGPAIVWVRIGNTTKRALLQKLVLLLPEIAAALEKGDTLVEAA
jgi:predicted nuclease of predicted toxin-antitoxin system